MAGEFEKTIEPEQLAKAFGKVPDTGVKDALINALFPKIVRHNRKVINRNLKIIKDNKKPDKVDDQPIVVNW
jgi:hypothetical protein